MPLPDLGESKPQIVSDRSALEVIKQNNRRAGGAKPGTIYSDTVSVGYGSGDIADRRPENWRPDSPNQQDQPDELSHGTLESYLTKADGKGKQNGWQGGKIFPGIPHTTGVECSRLPKEA